MSRKELGNNFTTKDAIAILRELGYIVKLFDNHTVKLYWQGRGSPSKARVTPLVNYLKAHKREVIDLLFSESLHLWLDIFGGKIVKSTPGTPRRRLS